jgi:hypothetical protein
MRVRLEFSILVRVSSPFERFDRDRTVGYRLSLGRLCGGVTG